MDKDTVLPKGTKVKIDSRAPYINGFNGQVAVANDKEGLVSKHQGFDLMSGGLVFLAPTDFTPLAA
jgi:hypothetical protein